MPTLNLPILDHLADSHSILITGIGGGFDLFCGLPLYFHLRERGYEVHLANYSFSERASVSAPSGRSPTLTSSRTWPTWRGGMSSWALAA